MKWPVGTRESQKQHALRHVESIYYAIDLCQQHRTAVQAGGNVGLWPLAMAKNFKKVLTFEPEARSYECLKANINGHDNIQYGQAALGEKEERCSIESRSLGSHRVIAGDAVPVIPLDVFKLDDVDLLQLDVEGYELKALRGAMRTIQKCRPIIQVEMRGFTEEYGGSDEELMEFMLKLRYAKLVDRPGADVIFRHVDY
jgi:FkbM family methyltransferase